jgi:dolichol-phosphate mannosyltransferase
LLGTVGLVFFSIGVLALGYLALTWVWNQIWPIASWVPLHQRPLVLYSVGAVLLGGQLMSVGFLAELITAYQGRDVDTYSVAEETPPHRSKTESIEATTLDVTDGAADVA